MDPSQTFSLHPHLLRDTITVGHFELCQLLLMNDAHYPWFILVPMREHLTETHQLEAADRLLLTEESATLSRTLSAAFDADKMNIAVLGNRVPQLHVHHVVRYRDDPTWPDPVWGRKVPEPYTPEMIAVRLETLKRALPEGVLHTP